MEPVAPLPEPVTAAQIRADWAKRRHPVSRQYVAKLLTKGVGGEKLPTASLEAAWLWRTQRTAISKLAGGRGQSESGVPTAVGRPEKRDVDGIEAMLDRVRENELLANKRWRERLLAKEYDAIAAETAERAWKSAAKTRAEVEALVAAHQKKIGLSVELSTAQLLIDERLSPLRSALHGLSREVAKELFPEDAARKRPQIQSAIARVLLPAIAIAKRRLGAAPPSNADRGLAA